MRMLLALAAAAFLLSEGCVVYDDAPYRHHGHLEVLVPVTHVHDAYCGHYSWRGRWYYWAGHRHGAGCGHVYVGGVWTVE